MGTLFFDIDGTLIDGHNGITSIPLTVVAQLERLHGLGYKLAICSGRPFPMIDAHLRLPLFDAYVMCNGAHVMVEDKTVFTSAMGFEVARHYANLFERLGCEYMIETAGHIYLNQAYGGIQAFFRSFNSGNIFTFDFERDDVLHRALKLEADVAGDRRERLLDEARSAGLGYTVNADENGGYNVFELYSPTMSKAVGMQKVIEYFGTPRQECYAFGDGANDLEMIRFAGTGVAMGNACDELKEQADAVCESVVENGLARYLATIGTQG